MSQRERIFSYLMGGLLLGGLVWLALTFDWTNQGGQYTELGRQLGNRRAVRTAEYAYVANARTKQYWPNREPYVSQIPAADRVWILDRNALAGFRGYTPGPP